jgi:hypothetical protein
LHNSEKIYEILESACVSDFPEEIPKIIESLSYEELAHLAEEIASFHSQNFQAVLDDLKNNAKEFNSYPLSHSPQMVLGLLRQLSLYSNKIVMRDPIYDALFNPAYVRPNIHAVKDALKSAIPTILELKPLVRSGIIQYVPYPALQGTLLKLAQNQIEDDLKNEEWKKEIIRTIAYKLYPEKNVLLMSLGDPSYGSYRFFRYGRIVGTEKETKDSLIVKMISPDSLLDETLGITQEDINAWIASEINNEVFRTTKTINENIVLAEAMNTNIVTDNEAYEKMLGLKNIALTGKSLSNLFPSILQISVPFIDNLPFDKLAELREKEKTTFLDCSKPSEIREQIRQITKEELYPILRKLEREYQRIKKSALIRGVPRAAIAFGTVVTSIAIGEPVILALGSIASWKLFKDVTDEYATYLEKEATLKENSLYFLWKAHRISYNAKKTSARRGFPDKIEVDGKEFAKKMKGLGIRFYPNVLGGKKPKENKDNGME